MRGASFFSILWRRSRRQTKRAAKLRRNQMDMSKFANSSFIKVDDQDLAKGPLQKVIAKIEEGQWEKPIVTFDDGTKLSLNGTNVATLIRAFGPNAKDWIKKKIELYLGTIHYNGNDNPAVLVRALETLAAADRTPPDPQPLRDDMADEIPF
jgi:hypothetical protein